MHQKKCDGYLLIRISVPWQSISKWWFITNDGCTKPLRWLCNGSWWAIGLLISVIAIFVWCLHFSYQFHSWFSFVFFFFKQKKSRWFYRLLVEFVFFLFTLFEISSLSLEYPVSFKSDEIQMDFILASDLHAFQRIENIQAKWHKLVNKYRSILRFIW